MLHRANFMYWYIAIVTFILLMIVLAAILYFRSIWVRKGYEGLNDRLELHEVRQVWLDVIGFIFILVIAAMILSQPIIHYEFQWYSYAICSAIITYVLGKEFYIDLKRVTSIFKEEPK